MFGNGGNAFGALAMEDDQPAAGPSTQVIDGDEVDVDWLKLVKTNHDVDVRVSDRVELDGLPNECNLMVVSNNWDLLIVGSDNDIRIHRLSSFHSLLEDSAKDASPTSEAIQTIPLPARPVWIRLAMNEERLVVATSSRSGVHIYKLREVLSGNTTPYHSFTSDIPDRLLDVLPNPAPSTADQQSRYVALLASEGLVIADIESCSLLAPLTGPFTCASWSAKGKQIVVGSPPGKLVQYTPEGIAKAEIPSPPDLESYHPVFVQWLENDLLLVSYAQGGAQADDQVETYTIYRSRGEFTFTKFYDPLNTMGLASRFSLYRHFAGLKSWGDQTKHIAMIVSGASSEIGILHGRTETYMEVPKWEMVILEETARGVLPAAKAGVRDDASVLALALDLTSTQVIQQGIVGGVELPDLPPQPRLLAYTQEGTIVSFDVRYPEAGPYHGMVTPQDISSSASTETQESSAATPQTHSMQSAKTDPSAGAFGSSAFGSTGFGQTSPAKLASTFGSSAFGSSSKPSAFGASAFGQTSAPTSTPSETAAGAFGSTDKPSAFSGFGQSSTSSDFGQSAFGQPAKPAAFGSSGTSSAFGSSTTPSSTPAKPAAFGGSSTSVPAFGSSSTPSKPAAFGSSAFGSSSPTPSAFGQSAFGQPSRPAGSTPSGFGASSTPSAFGSSATPSVSTSGFAGFGSASKPAAFGSSAFGQAAKTEEKRDSAASPFGSGGSAFGSKSAFGSSSAFGQSSFGQKSRPSSTDDASKPAFAGFGPKSDSSQSHNTSAFAGVGSNASSVESASPSAFGSFGKQASTTPSTASAKSPFEAPNNTAAKSSAFGVSGQSEATTPSPPLGSGKSVEQDEFGLGGFASALDGSSKSAGAPGLGYSPPESPILGAGKKPSGLEDDTPPNSPPPKSLPPQPAATSNTTATSFIKPATAFGSAPSVGAFGKGSKSSTPAFGSGSTPAAFVTPPSASPSAFGSSAFGKPSTIGSASPSAFGTTGFGQSSVPVGFGKSSIPASTKPIGSISGGFGAFGAKSEGEKKAVGFGEFGNAAGPSVFGGDASKESKPTGFAGFGGSGSKAATSVFGSREDQPKKNDQPATTSAFGAGTAFSFGSKPNTKPEETPQAPPTPEEEVQGYDVPAPAEDSKEQSTTPTATPAKNPAASETSTTPDSTPSKPIWPANGQSLIPDHVNIREYEPPAAGAWDHKTSDSSNSDTFHVSAGSASIQEIVGENGPEDAEDDGYEVEGEDDEAYDEEYGEEDYEDEYEEGEGDYEEDEEEADEEEEEVPIPSGRRRSTSIPPDMSPIREEASDEITSEEEDEDQGQTDEEESNEAQPAITTSAKSLTKSPPTWFAKPLKADGAVNVTDPVSPTPTSEGASLFSRLSPAPATQQEKPQTPSETPAPPKLAQSFSFKHASRTSSPLSAPPENASTTPESSPAKPPASESLNIKPAEPPKAPVFGGFGSLTQSKSEQDKPSQPNAFSLFGNKTPTEPKKDNDLTSAPPALGAFGSFGKPAQSQGGAAETKSDNGVGNNTFGAKPAIAPSPSTGGFSLFGNKPVEAPKTETPSLFDTAKSVPPVSAEPPKPAFGFGLGRPGSKSLSPAGAPSVSGESSLFASSTPSASAQATSQDKVPAVSSRPPVSSRPTQFEVPIRDSVPVLATRPDSGPKSMAGIIEKIILTLSDDIQNLQAVLASNARHHKAFNATDLPTITPENLAAHDIIAFSSITQLTSIVEELSRELKELRNDDNGAELKLAELQSRMLKTDMKTGQADKFLKARHDPSFAKVMQVKDLSPEQAASQTTLRKAVQVAESKIEDLDASITGLRRRAEQREQGKATSQQPALERVQRSVRNIDAAIRDRQQTIDELARRIGGIGIQSPSKSGSPAALTRNTPRKSTVMPSVPASKSADLDATEEIMKEVERALDVSENDKIISRLQKIKFARLTKPERAAAKGMKGPVLIDALPLPGALPLSLLKSPIPKKEPEQQATPVLPTTPSLASSSAPKVSSTSPFTPSTQGNTGNGPSMAPTPPSSSSGFGFGGIKFNLDPGNIADLAKSPSSGGSIHRGGGGGGTRSHTSAARFVPTQSSPGSTSAVPVGGNGLFDFKKEETEGLKDDQSKSKSQPSGFFR
uniref:Nucleoporin Nup159/Nup146 N-terminal domain-containing protein n=1 Tax=Kwoniella dejecticola CBS 10117 TaxID=1296121 RepID=A0A1A6ADF5_9TREE|nr:uncharacterized protein I303_02316 [Kwoniella dejecticola CBS 10117]OBR88097.1 hypothetical protein I303_02316 [Kwoniella dejecticola CBS 10117]